MAKRKLKDLPKAASKMRTVGQDQLKKVAAGQSLRQSHPALALELIDKGPYSADDIGAGSNRVLEWLHARCGQKIEVSVAVRSRAWDEGTASQGCYVCSNRYPDGTSKTIPEWLQKQCIKDTRKETKIKDISPWSQSHWQYRCPRGSGKVFSSRIIDRLNPFTGKEKQGCPCQECYQGERRNILIGSSKTDKFDLKSMFIRTSENAGFEPERLPLNHRVMWRCDKNQEHCFSRSLSELYESGCPKCLSETDESSLAAPAYRHIVREFLFVLRFPALTPSQIKPGSSLVAAFRCSAGHTFEKAVFRRTNKVQPENCPYCSGKRSDAPRLFSIKPYLLKRWHYEKNLLLDAETGEAEKIEPDDIKSDSRKKFWFYCHAGHSYRTSAVELLEGTDQCPACALLPNCVDNVRPELVSEWNRKKNGERTPWNTPAGSAIKVWWKCAQGPDHEWQAKVYRRALEKNGCPFCANKKLSKTNSLAALYPDLAKQMFPEDNGGLTALDVIGAKSRDLWWRCACGKKYKRVIQHMLQGVAGCNDCRKSVREGHEPTMTRFAEHYSG